LAIANEDQIGVLHNLNEIKVSLQKIAPFSSEYHSLLELRYTIEFDDIASEMNRSAES
jgi:DNA repair protein RecN (Recombination protein N)